MYIYISLSLRPGQGLYRAPATIIMRMPRPLREENRIRYDTGEFDERGQVGTYLRKDGTRFVVVFLSAPRACPLVVCPVRSMVMRFLLWYTLRPPAWHLRLSFMR